MSLLSRVWQFLFGFLANVFKSADQIKTYKELPTNEKSAPPKICHKKEDQSQKVIKSILAISLLFQLLCRLTRFAWLNRLICISTATVFIGLKSGSFLEHSSLVFVGDISYSLYLIHWPVIIFWKFIGLWDVTGPTVQEGLIILYGSIFLSFLFETGFKKLLASIRNWNTLSHLLLLLNILLILSAAMMRLRVPQISHNESDGLSRARTIMNQTQHFYENRNKMTLNVSREEVLTYNSQVARFMIDFISECSANLSRQENPPEFLNSLISCQVEGTGTKEIVIMGNSFARDLFFGVWPKMKHSFKRLTMYCLSCQIPYAIDKETGKYENDFVGLIKRWDRPIDILIVRHSYYHYLPHPKNSACGRVEPRFQPRYFKDRMSSEMQSFYEELSPLAKHIVIGYAEHESDMQIQKLSAALMRNMPDKLNFNYTASRQIASRVNKVIESIQCSNCIKVDYMKGLCDVNTDTCYGATKEGIMIWLDPAHVTLYGALLEADVLIDALNKQNVL